MKLITLTCQSCGRSWERVPKSGPRPTKCDECRNLPARPARPAHVECDVCGASIATPAWGTIPKRCSEECRRAHHAKRQREIYASGGKRHYAPRRSVYFPECRYCGALFAARASRATVCPSRACQLRKHADRNAAWRATYAAEHGRAYVPESYVEKKRAHGKARRARVRGAETEVLLDTEIYARDGWVCGLCHEPVDPGVKWPDPRSASIDHIIPIILDGAHTPANVQLAHLGCNSADGQRWRLAAKAAN